MRNNSQTSIQSNGQGTQQSVTSMQGQSQQTVWWQIFDWRILLLAFAGLSIAFTLIFTGYSALKK